MQRPGNGSSTQGEHINLTTHLFQVFLVRNAKALLLIYYKQAQVLKGYVLL